jgi:hypothetical protein
LVARTGFVLLGIDSSSELPTTIIKFRAPKGVESTGLFKEGHGKKKTEFEFAGKVFRNRSPEHD